MATAPQMAFAIPISMSAFIKFTEAGTNTQRQAAVLDAGLPYNKDEDFWRFLRQRIVRMHRKGESALVLDEIVQRAIGSIKENSYRQAAKRYQKWVGGNSVSWIGSSGKVVKVKGLCIGVKPELGLSVNEERLAVKLHLNKDPLSKSAKEIMLHLLSEVAESQNQTPVLHDVQRGNLIKAQPAKSNLDIAIQGHAAAFVDMWQSLQAPQKGASHQS